MVRRQLVLLLVPWALCTLTAIFGQSPDVPNLKRPAANCTHESPALNCTQFPTGKSVVTACVAEFAAPFVFRKKLTRTGQGDGFEYHTLTDFVNDFEGYDVDVLRAISAMKFGEVIVRVLPTFPAALYEVRKGRCDFGLSSFTVTEQRRQCEVCLEPVEGEPLTNDFACCLDFTAPYFTDGITVITKYASESTAQALAQRFWSPATVQAMCILSVFLIVSGHVVWFVERKKNRAQFQSSYLDGVDNGIWWSFVTMTTVGYGDKVPITIAGRIMACIWMITGIVMFGIFNGAVISVMAQTSSGEPVNLSGPSDSRLADSRLCTTSGSFEEYVRANGLRDNSILMDSLQECLELLLDGEAGSVLYDRLPLLEAIDTRRDSAANLLLRKVSPGVEVGKSFQRARFAAALPVNGTYNGEVADAIERLNAGEVVYSPTHGMTFGFSKEDNALRWTDFNEELEKTKQMAGQQSDSDWRATTTWIYCSIALTVTYICIQFGGLWVRRCRRYAELRRRSLRKSRVSLSMVPYKEDPSSSGMDDDITGRIIEQAGLNLPRTEPSIPGDGAGVVRTMGTAAYGREDVKPDKRHQRRRWRHPLIQVDPIRKRVTRIADGSFDNRQAVPQQYHDNTPVPSRAESTPARPRYLMTLRSREPEDDHAGRDDYPDSSAENSIEPGLATPPVSTASPAWETSGVELKVTTRVGGTHKTTDAACMQELPESAAVFSLSSSPLPIRQPCSPS